MDRKEQLEKSFLFVGTEINGITIHPLSANRRAFLRHFKNRTVGAKGGNLTEEEELEECFFVCCSTPEELTSYLLDRDKMNEARTKFVVSTPDGTLEKFADILMQEFASTKLAAVEPLGKGEAR